MKPTYLENIEVATQLATGAIAIMPTDTLYGVVASALQKKAIERVYELKARDLDKPCIILVDSATQVTQFGVPSAELQRISEHWPGPLSVIFSRIDKKYDYLCRNGKLPPFRVPASQTLRHFLAASGPLIAPSANLQGESPASTIEEAWQIFGNKVDFYIDGGERSGRPSTIVQIEPNGTITIIREGQYKL